MKTKFTFSKTFLVFAIALLLAGGELWSQQFIMQTGTAVYNASCSGVIKIKSNCGTPNVAIEDAFVNNNGNKLGTAKNDSIPGIVDWASDVDGQTVQVLYYESLVVSGGTKTIPTGVVVTGSGACPTLFDDYTDLSGYPFAIIPGTVNVTFQGDFTYESDDPVKIFPGGPSNPYNNLKIAGDGPAKIPGGDGVGDVVTGSINTGSGEETKLIVSGDLIITGGDDNASSNLGGEVTINEGGSITTGNGNVTFGGDLAIEDGSLIVPPGGAGGDGIVTLEGGTTIGSEGEVELGSGSNLVINGSIINDGDGTNLDFDCSSTITYSGTIGTQIIMPTLNVNDHRYGNLILTGGPKQGGTATYGAADYADIYTCGDLTVTGTDLDMITSEGMFYMTNTGALVTYGSTETPGNEEVMGKFGRAIGIGEDDTKYTFNNKYTSVTLANGTNNPSSFQFSVYPGEEPNNYVSTSDVERKITVEYEATSDFAMEISAGYLYDEGPRDGTTTWPGDYTQEKLRFYEADGTNDPEKVGTSYVYDRGNATVGNLGYVSLAGIGRTVNEIGVAGNDIGQFLSGNDLLLRSGRTTFYSINDGRWTNPATWDEGTVPTSIDNVEIRDMVYVGIKGSFAGTGEAGNQTPEHTHYSGDGAAANTITIAQKKDAIDSPNPSLIIGNEDNPVNYVFKTAAAGTSFTNLNTSEPSLGFPWDPNATSKGSIAASTLNGLWIIPIITQDGGINRIPAFGTSQIENSGTINNEGVIELGNCE